MPESQYGTTPGSLAATLDELVALARHLRETPSSIPSRLTRLEGLTQMLTYFCAPRLIGAPDSWPIALTTHCAHASCSRTWRDYDACLLNFAQRHEPPLWLCRDHHPPPGDGGIKPAGWQPDNATRTALNESRTTVLDKLTKAERQVINTKLVV